MLIEAPVRSSFPYLQAGDVQNLPRISPLKIPSSQRPKMVPQSKKSSPNYLNSLWNAITRQDIFAKVPYLWLIALSILILSCGKKGPPTLKAYEMPKAIASLNVMRIDGPLTISWDYHQEDRKGLKGFLLTRSSQNGDVELPLSPDTSVYIDKDIREFETYRYRIRAVNKKGIVGEYSKELVVHVCPLPLPPATVRYKVLDDAVVILWEASKGEKMGPCGGPIRHNVYSHDTKEGSSQRPLNNAPLDTDRFIVPVPKDKTAYYTVRSVVNTGLDQIGPPSEVIVVSPTDLVPSPPRIVNTVKSEGRVFVFWQEASERWVKGYRVYKKASSGEFEPVAEVSTPVFTEQTGDERETLYRVTSVGPVRESPPVEVRIIDDKR